MDPSVGPQVVTRILCGLFHPYKSVRNRLKVRWEFKRGGPRGYGGGALPTLERPGGHLADQLNCLVIGNKPVDLNQRALLLLTLWHLQNATNFFQIREFELPTQ